MHPVPELIDVDQNEDMRGDLYQDSILTGIAVFGLPVYTLTLSDVFPRWWCRFTCQSSLLGCLARDRG